MARPLRIEVTNGWHHVMARGNERQAIFRDDQDRARFVQLLGEVSQRHGLVVAAYVLMDKHYHLVLRTPLANLSRAMQWFNVAYSSAFNRRHRRSGHLFQGRFKSLLVDESEWLGELVRYVHLNPVRLRRLGLGKSDRPDAERGGKAPAPGMLRKRLRALRSFPWSSHRAYAGYASGPSWLETTAVLERMGRGSRKHRQAWYRGYVEEAIRGGVKRSPWEEVREGAVLGSVEFLDRLRKGLPHALRGERHRVERFSGGGPAVEEVRKAVETMKGEPWAQFVGRHGDSGRDIFLWLARRHCGLTHAELGRVAGGMKASAASEAARRVQAHLSKNRFLAKEILKVRQILNMEM